MKKIVFFACFVLVSASMITAQPAQESRYTNGVGIEMRIKQSAGDYGLGIGITSPWFWNNGMAIRVSSDVHFTHSNWRPYYNTSLYLLGGGFMASSHIRLYGGGGITFVFPAKQGEPNFVWGGGGFFGFEFFIDATKNGLSYFIELGGQGFSKIGYGTGFTTAAGLRYALPIK